MLSSRLVPDELWAIAEPLIPWRLLPEQFGVDYRTAHRRFEQWTDAGHGEYGRLFRCSPVRERAVVVDGLRERGVERTARWHRLDRAAPGDRKRNERRGERAVRASAVNVSIAACAAARPVAVVICSSAARWICRGPAPVPARRWRQECGATPQSASAAVGGYSPRLEFGHHGDEELARRLPGADTRRYLELFQGRQVEQGTEVFDVVGA